MEKNLDPKKLNLDSSKTKIDLKEDDQKLSMDGGVTQGSADDGRSNKGLGETLKLDDDKQQDSGDGN